MGSIHEDGSGLHVGKGPLPVIEASVLGQIVACLLGLLSSSAWTAVVICVRPEFGLRKLGLTLDLGLGLVKQITTQIK